VQPAVPHELQGGCVDETHRLGGYGGAGYGVDAGALRANAQAFAHHPYGDPAEVPGQNPEVGTHSEQSSLRALSVANGHAYSEFKVNGTCGAGA
jgi:hypothetical protein